MRAAPVLQVPLTRFSVWRAAMLALALFGALALVGWLAGLEELSDARKAIAMAATVGLLPALGAWLGRVPAAHLGWDGQGWTLQPMARPQTEPTPGELSVAIDLGPWMLLRFRPVASSRWAQPSWLPVQRRGLESQWHALRCAVYSPRPDDAAGGSAPR